MFNFFGQANSGAAPANNTAGSPGAASPNNNPANAGQNQGQGDPSGDPAAGTQHTGSSSQQGAPGNSQAGAAQQSPLDNFKQLWQTNETEAGKPKTYVTVDPAKLAEATGKLNFAAGLKPEQLQAITAGGEQAVTAFSQALNTVAQQVFQVAMLGSGKLMEQAIQNSRSDLISEIPAHLRHHLSMSQMQDKFPAISHPAVRPLVEVLQAQFGSQHPDASPAELQKMATDYLVNVTGILSGKSDTPEGNLSGAGLSGQPGVENVDWNSFFSPT